MWRICRVFFALLCFDLLCHALLLGMHTMILMLWDFAGIVDSDAVVHVFGWFGRQKE
jgi:hypothetical protein